jgi:capsular exopolysaccharide synthesis family protein
MSKFFEALERAETEQVLETPAPSPPPTVDPFASAAPAAPSAEVPPTPSVRFPPPVREARAPTTERAVDRSHRVGAHLVSLLDPRSFEAEQYRMLRHVVETLRKGAILHVVAVTSPGAGDGKTTTAINLAGALAQSADARVLLVDLDIRRPAVARQLRLFGARRSLVDALRDPGLTLEDTVEHLARFNLSVLPASGPAVAPYELLKSPRLEALLDEARRRYEYVVLDTPPFVPVPDGRIIAKYVDGFLIVVKAHRTPRGALAQTLDLVDPAKVTGLVFNGDNTRRSGYYDAYVASPRGARWRLPWSKP